MSETEARHATDATPVEPVHTADPDSPPSPDGVVGKHLLSDPEPSTVEAAEGDLESGDDAESVGDAESHDDAEAGSDVEPDGDAEPQPEPSWWHRSHPTFAGLVGFFVGVAYVIVIPGVYATLLNWLVPEKTAERLFPLVLIALIVPVGMLILRKTRRFAEFMFFGIISTALVVAATATVVLWVLVQGD
jgi:hypothetical protein